MSAAALRLQAFHAHIRALNALVSAVERLKVTAPDFPERNAFPASLGSEVKRKPSEVKALGLDWEALARKYHEASESSGLDDLLGDAQDELPALAARAREALLALNAYEVVS